MEKYIELLFEDVSSEQLEMDVPMPGSTIGKDKVKKKPPKNEK